MSWLEFTNPHFAEPRWLWLALLGPLFLLGLQRYSAWARHRQLAQLASPHFMAELTRSHSPLRRAIKEVLVLLGVAALGLTMARPQWGEQENSSRTLGHDIMFVFDCSSSMLATDVQPSRLQRARMAVTDYVQRHAHGRVGLVAFAGQAFLQCPLTYDYGAFEEALNAVNEKTIAVPGTDIGRALDEALRGMDKSDQRKLMILITDGEDLEKGGTKEAAAIAKQGALIFCIGVGTPAGSEIRKLNDPGQIQRVLDSKGEVVTSRLDETTLRTIAQITGGGYFPMGPVGEGLAKVRIALETVDDQANYAPSKKLGIDRFHVPLAIGLLLLVAESLLGTRKRIPAPA
jgi:Ca-activated chloride channel family protein